MDITWLGHSCFLIKGKQKTIITDPYHPDFGYRLGEPEADIVTVSHSHAGHNHIAGVINEPDRIMSPGEYEIGGTFITGVATFHDDKKGSLRGKNTIFILEMDGIILCHLGDLGHPLNPSLIEEIGDIDLLFLPIGEVSTVPIETAAEIVRQLEPHIVIPMHYQTESFTGDLSPVDKYLNKMRIRDLETRPKLSITPSSLPGSTQTVLLNYA
jgi:L-ascorbate metabolism protein UlaG (beta-lactamase superfamily)